jgi:polyisoprenoid-binding protein YceI
MMNRIKHLTSIIAFMLATNVFGAEIIKKEISFFVNHTTANVTGICNEINFTPVNLQAVGKSAYTIKSPFTITIPLKKITSGDDGRDAHIQEILGLPEFTDIIIKVESVKQEAERYLISGKMTIHGKTREFVSYANVETSQTSIIQIDGTATAKFSEYELENPSLLFMKAKDTIEIKYSFQLKK